MRLGIVLGGNQTPVFHDARGSFGDAIRLALTDSPFVIAHGPIYEDDPAADIVAPFVRSARESGWSLEDDGLLMPDDVLQRARVARDARAFGVSLKDGEFDELVEWSRAGLVLEIARRYGIRVIGRGLLRPNWRLRGTVTGRFGCEPVRGNGWTFNPLSIGPEDRSRIVASDAIRQVAVLDFRAMDVVSMSAVIPGLREILGDGPDPYQRVMEVTGLPRDTAKKTFVSWAYGSVVEPHVLDELWYHFRCVHDFTVRLEHGEFPRLIQSISARAFRAALSRALPLLTEFHFRPMFTVHDELVVDVSETGVDRLCELRRALEEGASDRVGARYHVRVTTGYTYEEAKGGS